MAYFSIGHRLPGSLGKALFGDRETYGVTPDPTDESWIRWKNKTILEFYYQTQKQSLGRIVNDAGYRILERIDLDGKRVLEIGPGDIPHMRFWRNTPSHLVLADIQEELLASSAAKLKARGVSFSNVLLPEDTGGELPFAENDFDIIMSFYSLEHLNPLERYCDSLVRCLRPGGSLVGAIPTEGGMMWGLGRYLTSRRWLLKNSDLNPNKLICWEHPNFAESVLVELSRRLEKQHVDYYPTRIPSIDLNLIVRFHFKKRQ